MSKRNLHHILVQLRKLRLWQLVLLFILMVGLSISFLRQNNLEMVRLRDAVKTSDANGGDVRATLVNLQRYVNGHMNTEMGRGIYLDNTYQQAYNRALQSAAGNNSPDSAAYQQADLNCRKVFTASSSFQAYVQCVTDKVSASGPAKDPLAVFKPPPTDLFKYNFASPIWSPDPAGFAVLAALILFIFIIGDICLVWLAYLFLRIRLYLVKRFW
ncbi:MAG TPA: hypothetical protein VNX65_00255 [Patescibacteria group bacterium]|jgi:hypothetical protein|nr:hypothetical protein [Patescibacteria group bacterium]